MEASKYAYLDGLVGYDVGINYFFFFFFFFNLNLKYLLKIIIRCSSELIFYLNMK